MEKICMASVITLTCLSYIISSNSLFILVSFNFLTIFLIIYYKILNSVEPYYQTRKKRIMFYVLVFYLSFSLCFYWIFQFNNVSLFSIITTCSITGVIANNPKVLKKIFDNFLNKGKENLGGLLK